MKKKLLQSFMLALVLILIACSNKDSEGTVEEVSEGISKATVINNVLEKTITSYKAKTEATVVGSSKNEELETTFTMDMVVQKEPFLIYFSEVYPEDMTKGYIDIDSEYYNFNNSERWYKISELDMDEKQELIKNGYFLGDFKKLLEFEDIFELKYREDEYILIAKVNDSSDKKSLAFVTDYVENTMKMELETKHLKAKINKFKYTLIFNKDFLLKSSNIIANIDLYEEIGNSNLILNSDTVYSDVNNVNNLVVPEEISRNAILKEEL